MKPLCIFTSALTNSGRLLIYLFMKSTIKIAFTGERNEPVIRVNRIPSDDLRDIMVSQFFEVLSGDSCFAKVQCIGVSGEGGQHWEISPLSPNSHYICHQRVEEIYSSIVGIRKDISMITSGESIGFSLVDSKGVRLRDILLPPREELRKMNIVELVAAVTKCLNTLLETTTK